MDWLIANYRPGAPPASIRVANTAADFQTSYYLQRGGASTARFTPVGKREQPHIILSITRWNAHLNGRAGYFTWLAEGARRCSTW